MRTSLRSQCFWKRGRPTLTTRLTIHAVPLALSVVISVCLLPGCRSGPDKLVFGYVAVPATDGQATPLKSQARALADAVNESLGVRVETFAFKSPVELAHGLGAGQVDIALLNPFAYVVAHQDGAEVLLKCVVGGRSGNRSCIITQTANGMDTLEELKGRVFAFVDPASPSGYLFPAAHLAQGGVLALQDLPNAVFTGDQVGVVKAVLDGTVYAAACDETALALACQQWPDVRGKIVVVARTPPVPFDTVAVRPGLDTNLVDQMKQALLRSIAEDEGERAWRTLSGADGLVEAQEPDYDVIRNMVDTLGLDVEVLAAGG